MDVDEPNKTVLVAVDLKTDMINYLVCNDKIVFKSQQRGEPDLSKEEKSQIALNCLEKSHPLFLSRFGYYLLERHLQYFENSSPDEKYEVDFYVNDIRKKLSARKNEVMVRNRRFEAMKRLALEGDYFTEGEMKKRNPLLYDQLVGQYLTQEERSERESFSNVRERTEDDGGYRLSTLLMEQWERDQAGDLKKQQLEKEVEEEFDSDSDSNEGNNHFDLWGETKCRENRIKIKKETDRKMTEEEKRLLLKEFQSHAYASFLAGDDSQFDYESVDNNTAYDDLEEVERDEEEKYFETDSIENTDISLNGMSHDRKAESTMLSKNSFSTMQAEVLVKEEIKPSADESSDFSEQMVVDPSSASSNQESNREACFGQMVPEFVHPVVKECTEIGTDKINIDKAQHFPLKVSGAPATADTIFSEHPSESTISPVNTFECRAAFNVDCDSQKPLTNITENQTMDSTLNSKVLSKTSANKDQDPLDVFMKGVSEECEQEELDSKMKYLQSDLSKSKDGNM